MREAWDRCRPWIEAALEHDPSGRTIEDVERAIASGGAILLAGEKSAMVVEPIAYRALHVWLAGGDLQELLGGEAQRIAMAKEFGCTAITLGGRSGWARVLRGLGYEVFIMKELDDGQKA